MANIGIGDICVILCNAHMHAVPTRTFTGHTPAHHYLVHDTHRYTIVVVRKHNSANVHVQLYTEQHYLIYMTTGCA